MRGKIEDDPEKVERAVQWFEDLAWAYLGRAPLRDDKTSSPGGELGKGSDPRGNSVPGKEE